MNRARPGESSAMPSQSSRCAGWGVLGSSTISARMKATTPMGTLMKKIQRQEALSTSQPPRIGPMMGAISIGTPRMPMTRPMRLGPAFLVMNLHRRRHVHPAADALDLPEEEERAGTPGQARQHRADGEEHQRCH